MTTAIVYGSVRNDREGIRAAKFMQAQLTERGHRIHFIDPVEAPLPLLDKMYKEFQPGTAPATMELTAKKLAEADGFIVVTGEYNHSVPPALKNLLDHFQKEYFFKPSGIVSYSAGRFGGVRAAVHLRVILAELGTPSIPIILPVPKVGQAFDTDGKTQDEFLKKSSLRFLNEYEWYLKAMKTQRQNGTPY